LLKAQEKAEKAREENGKEMDRLDKELKAAMRRAFEALGRLGNSLGQFTEGLVYPSIVKILRQRFKVHVVTQNPRSRRNGTELELDALGYSSGEHGQAYVVEIKSKFGEDQFQQFLKTLAAFPKFFPEHADKPVYGVVAAVTMPDNIRQRLLKAGIYVARIHDNICTLRVPRGFKPKAFHSGRRV
jgi:hypothetical protein